MRVRGCRLGPAYLGRRISLELVEHLRRSSALAVCKVHKRGNLWLLGLGLGLGLG